MKRDRVARMMLGRTRYILRENFIGGKSSDVPS